MCFLCEIKEGVFQNNIETDLSKYFPFDKLPPLSTRRITDEQIKKLFQLAKSSDLKQAEAWLEALPESPLLIKKHTGKNKGTSNQTW